MKSFTIILFILFSIQIQAQDNQLVFSYDTAGNQIQRVLFLCTVCTYKDTKPYEKLESQDFQKFIPEDNISYYPNPVKEELFLKWELVNNNKVAKIQVFAINGTLLKTFLSLETANDQIINFQEYPTGDYFIEMFYTNGEKKSIQIIKK